MSSESIRLAQEIGALLAGRDIVAMLGDPTELARARTALEPLVEPGFEVSMVGPDYLPETQPEHGFDGFREAWLDWTSPFETFRIDVDEVIDAGDTVVSLAHQTGTTKTGGVVVETAAAAVITIRDRRISRIEFHLDPAAALRAAGLPP